MRIKTALILIAMLLFCNSTVNAASKIMRVSDRTSVELQQMVEDAGRADTVFIGDTHNDKALHKKQLEIVRALHAKDPRIAIGLEMFTTDSQRYLDDWTSGKMDEKDFIAVYAKNWSYDWSLYRDIFIFARDNRLPMIALNVPKPVIAKVVRQGAKSLNESDRKELPPGVGWTLHPRQADYLKRIREQVFRNVPARVPASNFDEAQALRNDTMAYSIAKFREKSPKSKVVAIVGTWHAIRNGVPESIKKYAPLTNRVVLPNLPDFAWLKPSPEDVDYLIPLGEQPSPGSGVLK